MLCILIGIRRLFNLKVLCILIGIRRLFNLKVLCILIGIRRLHMDMEYSYVQLSYINVYINM